MNDPDTATTEVEFSLGLEDLLAFNEYRNAHSPAIRGQRLRARLVVLFMFVAIGLAMCLPFDQPGRIVFGLGFGLVGIVCFILLPGIFRRQTRRLVERIYSEGQNRGVYVRHRLTITPETITEATEITVATWKWVVVEKIDVDRQHAYFFVTGFSAIVLPKASFQSEAEFHDFVETARQYQREAPQ